jgi:membrane fusion protein (multidrug efflux system)
MEENGTTRTVEQEIAQLREEVRRLREAREGRNSSSVHEPDTHEPPAHESDGNRERQTGKPESSHGLRHIIIAVLIVAMLTGGVLYWLNSRHYEDTDDAQVDGHISGIATRVAGTITGVYAMENDPVQVGQLLADLDPRDYQAAVDHARGELARAQAEMRAEQPNVPLTQVTTQTTIATSGTDVSAAEAAVAAAEREHEAALERVRQAEANNIKAQADVARYRPLVEKDEVAREQFDQVVANARSLEASVRAAQASAESARKQVDQRQAQLTETRQRAEEACRTAPHQLAVKRANVSTRQAAVVSAKAQLDQALLNLSYCKIASPVTGIVARRTAEVGAHVTPGQQLVLVTQTRDMWVTANFRETQVRLMRAGQSATIYVDALGQDFQGYVEGMPAASGAVTSLLPPENATGNFVKVVQRLPVRLRFKSGQKGLERLRPGMSVEPKVRVQ